MLHNTNTQQAEPSCFRCERSAASVSLKEMLHTERLWFVWLELEFYVDTYSASPCQPEKSISLGNQSVGPQSSFKPAALPLCERSPPALDTLLLLLLQLCFVDFCLSKFLEEGRDAMKSKWWDSGVLWWPSGWELYLMTATSPVLLLLRGPLVEYSFSLSHVLFLHLNCHCSKKAKCQKQGYPCREN